MFIQTVDVGGEMQAGLKKQKSAILACSRPWLETWGFDGFS
jgi:hypothetical protein